MKFRYILILLGIIVFFSCNRNPLKIDVSDINVNIQLKRLEKDLFETADDKFKQTGWLNEKHGEFFDIFTYRMIQIGGSEDSLFGSYLNAFKKDTFIVGVYNESMKLYDDLAWLEKDLSEAFKHYNYYFPQKNIPEIYTCVSGFNQSVVTAENTIGISLDKFLGADCEYYAGLMLPVYKRRSMHKDKILSDVMLGWAYTEFGYNDSIDNLLGEMIYHGKIMYFMDAMLPEHPDSLKIGYTAKQLDFCKANEVGFWTFFVERKLLFSTELHVKRRYIKDAPYTADFSADSPGRTGIWMGWQIVRSYMKKHPEITLEALMDNDNYQAILNRSGYDPVD